MNSMTDATNKYEQLLELAVLEAHGLLEPIESELFTKSFHDAPASVQDQIIQLQRDFAVDTTLLPTDTPSSSLKQKVLRSVTDAADQEAERLAPLALIGARASASKATRKTKQTHIWRIVALILFGVSVVLGIVAVDTQRRIDTLTQIAMNVDSETTIANAIPSQFKAFIANPYCHITRLERENGNPDSYLRIATNEMFGGGYVLGIDLEEGEEIVINGTTPTGEVLELARFTANGSITGHYFSIDKSIVPGLQITATNASTGQRWI